MSVPPEFTLRSPSSAIADLIMEKVKEGSTLTHSQTMAMTSDQQMDPTVVDQWAHMLNARQRAIDASEQKDGSRGKLT